MTSLRLLRRTRLSGPWITVLLAALFLIDAVVIGTGVADRLGGGGTDDLSSESAEAAELMEEHFPSGRPNFVLLISGTDGRGVDDREVASQGARLAERLAFEPSVTGLTSYWQTGAEQLRSDDGRYALVLAHIEGTEDEATAVMNDLADRYRGSPQGAPGLEVRIGGSLAVLDEVQTTIEEDLLLAELIAFPVTLLILVLVFGGLVAALLPLVVGVVAILGTNAALRLITEFADVSVFAQNLTTALGLGLAIDYALLMLRRYREEIGGGAAPRDAVATTVRTAGRAVLYSALTVAVSLAAMLVFPLYFLRSFAYAGISVVLLAAGAALVLLPALLLLLGHRVDALRIRRRRPAAPGGARREREEPEQPEKPEESDFWGRLVVLVVRRAPLFALGTTALLVAVGLPFLGVEFGTTDDRQLPDSAESHVVQQTIRDHFASAATSAVEIVTRGADGAGTDEETLERYAVRLSELPGVAEVDSPVGTYENGEVTLTATPVDAARTADGMSYLSVVPESGSEVSDPASQRMVADVRKLSARDFPGLDTLVGGDAAELADSKDAIADRLVWAALIIVATSLLLMFLLTGSVLIPVGAVVLNALSLTAMFGAVVWVFQDGHLSGLLGFTATGTIETTLPVLMFCVAYGLSMDYGVFLLSRVTEEYQRTGDPRHALVAGVRRTGGVITAAALILAVVLVAIGGTSRIMNTKMLGLGVALAVIVDSTVVRGLLVPAVMRLGGKATWWAPAPLRRFQQRFGLREDSAPAPEATPPVKPTERVLEDVP